MSKAAQEGQKQSLARQVTANSPSQADFDEVLRLIDAARTRAVAAVNTTLIELYWSIGEYISRKIESAAWGKAWSSNWPPTSPERIPACGDIPARICFGCGSSTRPTGETKKSQHC